MCGPDRETDWRVLPTLWLIETSEVFKTSEVCLEFWTDPVCFACLTFSFPMLLWVNER